MKKIEYRICKNNLGESDDEFIARYIDALERRLREQYPDYKIDVNLSSNFANTSQILITDNGEADQNEIDDVANQVWEQI